MDVRHLELIVAITDEGTFTAAAARLRIAQPAVSHQVRTLERQLGYPLFRRTARGATPTPQCQALLPSAREALSAMDDARAIARHAGDNQLAGRVRMGAAFAVHRSALTRAIAAHAREHPRVEVSVLRRGSRQLMDLLGERQVDLAVLAAPTDQIAKGVQARWLPPVEVVCVAPLGHPLAHAQRARLEAVLSHTVVSLPTGSGLRASLQKAADAVGANLRIGYEADDLDLVLDLVAQGLGIALLPLTAVRRPDLAVIALDGSPLAHHVAVAWPTRPSLRQPAEQLRDRLLEAMTTPTDVPTRNRPQPTQETL
jgi:DNA-binding transcriptional LysR family regulator